MFLCISHLTWTMTELQKTCLCRKEQYKLNLLQLNAFQIVTFESLFRPVSLYTQIVCKSS